MSTHTPQWLIDERLQMQKNSRYNRDYHDLNEVEVSNDRAIEMLEQVLERNPMNDEAKRMLKQLTNARARFPLVQQALLE